MSDAPTKVLIAVLAGFLAGTFVQMAPSSTAPATDAEWMYEEEAPRVVLPATPLPLPTDGPQTITIALPLPPPHAPTPDAAAEPGRRRPLVE